LGAMLLVAAAVKLILLDFGSLGQLGNILAMIAAGGVFLLVAWLAPFPPREKGDSESGLHNPPRGTMGSQSGGGGRILGICALAVFALVAKSIAGHARGTYVLAGPVAVSRSAALDARNDVCGDFARRFVRELLAHPVEEAEFPTGVSAPQRELGKTWRIYNYMILLRS